MNVDGREGKEQTMEQVRLGIIGIGGMGTEHAKRLLAGNVPTPAS